MHAGTCLLVAFLYESLSICQELQTSPPRAKPIVWACNWEYIKLLKITICFGEYICTVGYAHIGTSEQFGKDDNGSDEGYNTIAIYWWFWQLETHRERSEGIKENVGM